jgi:hypothetical protein
VKEREKSIVNRESEDDIDGNQGKERITAVDSANKELKSSFHDINEFSKSRTMTCDQEIRGWEF